jgi:hypothetical protein
LGERQKTDYTGRRDALATQEEITGIIARILLASLIMAALANFARAQPSKPLKPLNLNEVDPAMAGDLYGPRILRGESGGKTCRVNLRKARVIGGSEIEIAPDCAKNFPIMGEITAWRGLGIAGLAKP